MSARNTNLLATVFLGFTGPEHVRAGVDATALVRLLEKLGRRECTLSAQRFVVLLTEARNALERGNDERYGSELSLAVTDLILVQRECLQTDKNMKILQWHSTLVSSQTLLIKQSISFARITDVLLSAKPCRVILLTKLTPH